MKNNKVFSKFLELSEQYKTNPKKKVELEDEIITLVSKGYATPTLRIVYDLGIEKYRTIGLEDMAIKIYDKDKSIKGILRKTYKILPKNILDYIPFKELVFNPHKPLSFVSSGIDYANLFIPSKFYQCKVKENEMIDFLDWNKYPNIKALFENVFKTTDRMNYFMNWLSYGFQTRKKAGTAIISKGEQGVGKGVIFEEIIKYAVGEPYTHTLNNDALKSRFNGELENKLFILANEIKADFREGNTMYETLKMYITDPTIRFEEKNIKARTIPNFFNIWFHSNHEVPLQIQGSDRRYTVFNTKSKKLTVVSKELGFNHISFYIEAIKRERDSFLYDLMRIKYDMSLATTPLQTEEKELIYEASMTKIEVMSDKLKKHDIEYFKDYIEDFYQSNEENLQDIKRELAQINIKEPNSFVRELNTQLTNNYIKNDLSRLLYKIFVNESEKDRKIGLSLNNHFGKAVLKNLNGNRFKYRKIDKDKKVIFEEPKTAKEIIQDLKANGNLTIEDSQDSKEAF